MNTATQGRSALLALLACAVLSFIDNFVIAVSEEAGLWQFQILRAAMALPLLFGFAYVKGARLRPANWHGLIWRSGIVGVGLLLYFAALSVLPVAQAGAGLFSAPLWILVFSALFFGQRLTLAQVCLVLIGFVGVLLLLQPDLASLGWLSGMSILAGAVYGLGMLLTPHFCSNEHPIALSIGVIGAIGVISVPFAVYFSLFPSPSGGFLTAGWAAMSGRFLALTLLQAVGAAVAVTLIAEAYRTGAPSFVAVVEYSFLVFATIWSFVIWNISPNSLGIIGIGIILVVAVLLYRLGKMGRAPRLDAAPVGNRGPV